MSSHTIDFDEKECQMIDSFKTFRGLNIEKSVREMVRIAFLSKKEEIKKSLDKLASSKN